jgi:hypothetical protein
VVFFVLEDGMIDEFGLHTVGDNDGFRRIRENATTTDWF